MKKILFFILLSMSVTCFGQGTQSIDSIQITEADSIHAGSHTFSDTKLEDVTKAEGDSAYIKDDYATAIQIYESLLKNGESADVYYNLGNSYYKGWRNCKSRTQLRTCFAYETRKQRHPCQSGSGTR